MAIIRVDVVPVEGGNEVKVTSRVGGKQEEGHLVQGAGIAGRVEDLYVSGVDRLAEKMTDMFLDNEDLRKMTPAEAVASIVSRCQGEGLTVEPGETILDNGQWTFRGWRLSQK